MNDSRFFSGTPKDDLSKGSQDTVKSDNHLYLLAISVAVIIVLVLELFSALRTSELLLSALAAACCALAMSGEVKYRRTAIVLFVFAGLPYLSGILLSLSVVPLLFCHNK